MKMATISKSIFKKPTEKCFDMFYKIKAVWNFHNQHYLYRHGYGQNIIMTRLSCLFHC